ncbi:hypothetical protein EAG_14833 [Camponotus floridanus]|uniref:Uncharacterized protein n=1 Tax=Camponotus floridanus TaxID=104421 RepID=E2ABR7_CAMFO|nr:hypothetical protein EAG_14833 [Camponotus floridanus]
MPRFLFIPQIINPRRHKNGMASRSGKTVRINYWNEYHKNFCEIHSNSLFSKLTRRSLTLGVIYFVELWQILHFIGDIFLYNVNDTIPFPTPCLSNANILLLICAVPEVKCRASWLQLLSGSGTFLSKGGGTHNVPNPRMYFTRQNELTYEYLLWCINFVFGAQQYYT